MLRSPFRCASQRPCWQGKPNNYETDLIRPIIDAAAGMAGIEYDGADEATKLKLKVIGDHTRAVSYLIADGVLPSNVGRGYIVRWGRPDIARPVIGTRACNILPATSYTLGAA
jgi:hypothetical protein